MNCPLCKVIENAKEDPYYIMELETGYVMLGWYQHFKGYTMFIYKEHATELHQLDKSRKMKYLEEMSLVSEALYNIYKPDKMNYELLGNGVPHMHWHLIPRRKGDSPYGGPVWWMPKEELYDENTRPDERLRSEMIKEIREEIERLIHLK